MRKSYGILTLLLDWIFWYIVPTVSVKIKWPVGEVIVYAGQPGWDWTMGASAQLVASADPNDHYRPWLEKHIGKQGWSWNWRLINNDTADNTLTLRVRRDKAKYATMAAMKWA